MTFDPITNNENIWAIRYPHKKDNVLVLLFEKWYNVGWLKQFFCSHMNNLKFFNVSIEKAIMDTLEDIEILEELLLSENPNLEPIFQPLGINDIYYLELKQVKARLPFIPKRGHNSWIRLYAIKLEINVYVITGGAIKLTRTMQEDPLTKAELDRLNECRTFLLGEGVFDKDSFLDLIK